MILAQLTTSQPAGLAAATNQLLQHVSDLVKFYGLTAGFVGTLYALYTKDNELRQSHRELFRVLVLVLLAFLIQSGVWVITDLLGNQGACAVGLSLAALVLYAVASLYFFGRVTVISYLRIEKFKERPLLHSLKHLPGIRGIIRWHTLRREAHYETTVRKRQSIDKYQVLHDILGRTPLVEESRGASFLLTYEHVRSWLSSLARITKEHLANGETVTVVACRHHPAHILSYIEHDGGVLPEQDRKKLIIVDAFTPAFGGDDEIFHKFLRTKTDDGYTIVSARSLAGIHSGAAQAFKLFKKSLPGQRLPGTVIYDGLLVYEHCEALDHVIRFVTHMVEAERTYAMITVLGEPVVVAESLAYGIVASLVDYVAELDHGPAQAREKEVS